MADAEIHTTLTEHHWRLSRLEEHADDSTETRELLTKVRVDLASLKTRLEITWYFLAAIVIALMTVAFSLWTGGSP